MTTDEIKIKKMSELENALARQRSDQSKKQTNENLHEFFDEYNKLSKEDQNKEREVFMDALINIFKK